MAAAVTSTADIWRWYRDVTHSANQTLIRVTDIYDVYFRYSQIDARGNCIKCSVTIVCWFVNAVR